MQPNPSTESGIEKAIARHDLGMQFHDQRIPKNAVKNAPEAAAMLKEAVEEVMKGVKGATAGDVLRAISRKFGQLVHLGPLIKKDLDAEEALEAAKAEAATQAAEAAAAAAAAATAAAGTGNSGTSLSGGNIDFKPTTTNKVDVIIGPQGGNAELIAKMEMMEVKVAAMNDTV